MKKESVYFYPSADQNFAYCTNFKNAIAHKFNVLNLICKRPLVGCFPLFKYSFVADIFILNWPENIIFARFGILQYYIVRTALKIIKIRKKKIVYIFHNFHPHQGINKYSKKIQDILLKNSTAVISHSKDAATYAQTKTSIPIYYRCHPVKIFDFKINKMAERYDVLIWGEIYPYKGIVEFLSFLKEQKSNLKILILGHCGDKVLAEKITSLCNETIIFNNRKADFDEIASLSQTSKYVLFPYIGKCVSSSGALIDAIVMNGNVCGPNVGAFKDLYKQGVAFVYNSYNELLDIIRSGKVISVQKKKEFIEMNSWENFGDFIYKVLKNQPIDTPSLP